VVKSPLFGYNCEDMSSEDINNSGENEEKSPQGIGSLIQYNRKLRDSLEEAKAAHRAEAREFKSQIRDLEEAQKDLQSQAEQWEAERLKFQSSIEAAQAALAAQADAQAKEKKASEEALLELRKSLTKTESRGKSLDKLKQSLLEQSRTLRAELNEFKSSNKAMESKIATLVQERDALAEPAARIDALEAENIALKAQLEQQTEEIKTARRYIEEAESREAENVRLQALAEQKSKEAEAAVRAQAEAETLAFESRQKLLELYTQEESKEIMATSLAVTRAQLETTETELAEALMKLEASEKKFVELEEKVLYSSERESLRMSLASRVKRRES
jgi:hypothetical protein